MVRQIGYTLNVVEENVNKFVRVTTTTTNSTTTSTTNNSNNTKISPETVGGRAVIYTKKI